MKNLSMGLPDSNKKKIVVFCDFYLPGIKSGGGMWTVANLVDRFCDRYEFFVVTRNYDSKSDTEPYTSVRTNEWNQVGNARVYYVAAKDLTRATCGRLVNEVAADCVYLNSAFSTPVVKFLMARARGMTGDVPVVLASCGELSAGALKSKSIKKKIFLRYAKAIGLYNDLIWKASSDLEVREIQNVFGPDIETMVAPDLTPKTILPDFTADLKPQKEPGSARFIFLSRVVPKKNLKYLLERLRILKIGNVELEIVGPLEDKSYWRECQALIGTLPANVRVEIVGGVSYPDGLKRLCSNHFFVLPTLNENFGYVFIESLAAGTPLLTTDSIVWDDIEEQNAGWRIPLENSDGWSCRIDHCIRMNNDEYRAMSAAAREYAVRWLAKPEFYEATANVLSRALNGSVVHKSDER